MAKNAIFGQNCVFLGQTEKPDLKFVKNFTRPYSWTEIRIFSHLGPGLIAGSFGALLVDWLVVVARGLYLARHLFTLFQLKKIS